MSTQADRDLDEMGRKTLAIAKEFCGKTRTVALTKGPEMNDEFELFSECDFDAFMTSNSARYYCAAKANKKFAEFLSKGTVVTGHNDKGNASWWTGTNAKLCAHTHQATLVNVRPIEPDDSAERVLADLAEYYDVTGRPLEALVERARKLIGAKK